MKKYDHCLVRESAKLTKIYNMILRESECSKEDLDEEKCPDCGKDPCECDENENSGKCDECDMIPEKEFFEKECDDSECDMIPEKDFIVAAAEDIEENDMLRNRPHNGHIDDPAGVVAENDKPDDESNGDDDSLISAKEFFAEAEKENAAEDVNEEVEMMSAEEFFKNAGPAKPEAKKEKSSKAADMNEDSVEIEPDCKMVDVRELLAEKDNDEECNENDKDEKNLEESLKSYRRKNHRLFND